MGSNKTEVAFLFDRIYPVRRVSIEGYGDDLRVSTESLEKAMFDEKGQYRALSCVSLDEGIFFYVDDKDINLPDEELVKKIKESL